MNRTVVSRKKQEDIPSISIPMHLSSEAVRIRLERDELLENHDIKTTFRGLTEIDSQFDVINEKREEILEKTHLSDEGKRLEFTGFVEDFQDSQAVSQKHGRDKPITHYISTLSDLLDRKEEETKSMQSKSIKEKARPEIANEIRQHAANLPDKGARMRFLKKCVDREDWVSCSAIFDDIPAYLLGLDDETYQNISNYHLEKRFPDMKKISDGYGKIREALQVRIERLERLKKSLGIKKS